MKLMGRWPIIITLGAGLLGFTAIDMMITDPVIAPYLHASPRLLHTAVPVMGAIFVIAVGKWFAVRARISR